MKPPSIKFRMKEVKIFSQLSQTVTDLLFSSKCPLNPKESVTTTIKEKQYDSISPLRTYVDLNIKLNELRHKEFYTNIKHDKSKVIKSNKIVAKVNKHTKCLKEETANIPLNKPAFDSNDPQMNFFYLPCSTEPKTNLNVIRNSKEFQATRDYANSREIESFRNDILYKKRS